MTIMIVLVVLGSSVLLSLSTYQRAKRSLISQMENNYAVAAQKYALELTSWISTNATIIDTLAAEISVNDISAQGYDVFHNYLKHSNELLNKNGYVYDVYFTYPNNTMVCASDFIADGTVDFVHEREWYTTSALTGKLFYATPYLDSDTKKPIITISKAVYKDDELLGVLAVDIFVDVLIDMVKNADVADNSYAFLIDQNQRMIVHPNSAYDYEDTPLLVMDVPGSPYGELMDSIDSGSDKMVFVKDYDGVSRGISVSQMTNTGWYVCLATSTDALEEGADSLVSGFVIATIISIVVGVLFAVFLARVLDKLTKQEQEYKQQVLRLEKQAADEASKAKSRFLADMSHEIRTPINAIIGMNEMIMRETDSDDIKGYSGNIRQSGRNLLQLINGILDFSKIEDGKMEIVPVRYAVADMISYLFNSVSDRAAAKNLSLNFDIDPTVPAQLYGDDARIDQVVVNLLTNAVKYTETGSVTLTIKTAEKNDDSILLYFEVKDTGIGIKESDMNKLFESFERLDVVRNRNIEGTGLGMTITTKLLELMDSKLDVSSKYGEGSVFSFRLWQKIASDKPLGDYREAIRHADTSYSYTESFHAENARILVVDDTKMNLLVVENLLKKTGIKIDTAISGPDSIKLAAENEYDVILMDQRMPVMDGTEAMKHIKEADNAKNANTPVICLTADVIKGAKDRYIKQGFDDYLTKPIDGNELEEMLIRYLPGDKVQKNLAEKTMSASSLPDGDLYKAISLLGVDIKVGMKYSSNDENMYLEVLKAFVAEEKTKLPKIEASYSEKNWDDYGIYIHSVKSTSKTIGAAALCELAASLEAAAKKGDATAVEKGHSRAVQMYKTLADTISGCLEQDASDDQYTDDVLEFFPEQ